MENLLTFIQRSCSKIVSKLTLRKASLLPKKPTKTITLCAHKTTTKKQKICYGNYIFQFILIII